MTLDHHLRLLIGDQAVRLAAQAAEIDTLRAQLAAVQAKAPPADTPPARDHAPD